ncbi:uncharacterized protein EHS24_003048 [Apiotrichum porosum]|uniref:Uncharacterized protein n=1 Tax=Apiotrichum porosum TaxID=105984 RepID=A0A427XGZ2_9TREE|nr:uncharacterized protein EHS24_003048 [Apiotrichum porosum]RSH77974.1 hypothetical protein EHS24_003048 [Apiotrichum porosum]
MVGVNTSPNGDDASAVHPLHMSHATIDEAAHVASSDEDQTPTPPSTCGPHTPARSRTRAVPRSPLKLLTWDEYRAYRHFNQEDMDHGDDGDGADDADDTASSCTQDTTPSHPARRCVSMGAVLHDPVWSGASDDSDESDQEEEYHTEEDAVVPAALREATDSPTFIVPRLTPYPGPDQLPSTARSLHAAINVPMFALVPTKAYRVYQEDSSTNNNNNKPAAGPSTRSRIVSAPVVASSSSKKAVVGVGSVTPVAGHKHKRNDTPATPRTQHHQKRRRPLLQTKDQNAA